MVNLLRMAAIAEAFSTQLLECEPGHNGSVWHSLGSSAKKFVAHLIRLRGAGTGSA